MKIIGAGFGRTGTTSLRAALNDLGFGPTYHMNEVFQNLGHVRIWHAAARGESIDWKNLLTDYQSTLDYPASVFYRDLMEVYPDARVLLSVRDPDSWYASTRATIYMGARPPRLITTMLPPLRRALGMVDTVIWQGLFDGRFEDRDHAIEVFNQHIEDVKAVVPADRLLVFDVKQGWEPLCAFLEVPVPDTPFPHLNDRSRFKWVRRAMRIVPPLIVATLLGLLAFALHLIIRSFS